MIILYQKKYNLIKVVDIFAGSNTTGFIAEQLERSWMAFEKEASYLAS
jgi:site-specific DNA-methyltransferase (cytosine-N4-specific)